MKEFDDDDDDHKQKLKVYPLKMIRHYLLLKYIFILRKQIKGNEILKISILSLKK